VVLISKATLGSLSSQNFISITLPSFSKVFQFKIDFLRLVLFQESSAILHCNKAFALGSSTHYIYPTT